MMDKQKIYPRSKDRETVYLKNVVTDPSIIVGDYTMYNDFVNDPVDFQKNNVLYHYPINHDRLIIGKFCSIACGARFLFNSANHSMTSLATYPFPIFFEEWGLDVSHITEAWDNKGDIVIGSDVWIGYEAVIFAGVTICLLRYPSPRTASPVLRTNRTPGESKNARQRQASSEKDTKK